MAWIRMLTQFLIAALGPSWSGRSAEVFEVPVTVRQIPRPASRELGGPLPRPVLLVRTEERGEAMDAPMVTSYWAIDPADPDRGLRKVFSGPGNDQYLRFVTPLFGGCGVACGQLDPKRGPQGEHGLFWFDLLEGRAGEPIDDAPIHERLDENGLTYERFGKQAAMGVTASRIVRFDPLGGTMRTVDLPLADLKWINRREAIGIGEIEGSLKVVRLNVESAHAETVGTLPDGYDLKAGFDAAKGVYPAGADAVDGIYAINEFSLWFLPKGGSWHLVVKNVHIVKTFGGLSPHLPVRYLGHGRFAVARTTKDNAPIPDDHPKDERIFGAAESVTMWIDGRSGEVLAESDPRIYNHNPEVSIPDAWWAPGRKPKEPEPAPEAKSRFQWDESGRDVQYAGGRQFQLGEDDETELSADGRYLAVYEDFPKRADGKRVLTLRIIDGESGEIHVTTLASDFDELVVDISWQILCSEKLDANLWRSFQGTGIDWFREPIGNW